MKNPNKYKIVERIFSHILEVVKNKSLTRVERIAKHVIFEYHVCRKDLPKGRDKDGMLVYRMNNLHLYIVGVEEGLGIF